MTSTKPPTRPSRHVMGHRGHGVAAPAEKSAVGEKLRGAREVRGVDLFRVERDTKIRTKFLSAMESGDFADLPGDVYTRGFLRNYATYLGLDADEIEDEWRAEAGTVAPLKQIIVGPQPLTMRRKVVFERSHVVIGIVAAVVLIVASYFGFQLTRYLSYPTLSVASAGASPVIVGIGDTQYVLTGVATPNTTVLISWNGQDPTTVIADDSGHWLYHAILQAGSNQFDITAKNLDTNHASTTVRLIVMVPVASPSLAVPAVAFATPLDTTVLSPGTITVTGTSTLVSSVSVTSSVIGPPLLSGATLPPEPVPAATAAPGLPVTSAAVSADGTFSMGLSLQAGLYRLTLVGITATGAKTAPVTKTITIPFKGISVNIKVQGVQAWLRVFRDGVAVDKGVTRKVGYSTTVTANRSVCIYSTRPNAVFIVANGNTIGLMSGVAGVTHVYIDSKGPKGISSC
jgi:cytoskeletal protein RodZ